MQSQLLTTTIIIEIQYRNLTFKSENPLSTKSEVTAHKTCFRTLITPRREYLGT